jgi:hypothetical protein
MTSAEESKYIILPAAAVVIIASLMTGIGSTASKAVEQSSPQQPVSTAAVITPVSSVQQPVREEPKKVVETVSKEMFFSELEKFEAKHNEMKESYESQIQALKVQLSEQPAANAIVHNPEFKTVAQFSRGNGNKRGFSMSDRISNLLHN